MADFSPRFSKNGIYLNDYYYSKNPFFTSGYGLPNCTCYAWGRTYEISGVRPSYLSLGDAGKWYPAAVANEECSTGTTVALGAIICYASTTGGSGHVAVVEQINQDGSFIISQSGYYRPIEDYPPDTEDYFWTDECDAETKKASWMRSYEFQGFIYNTLMPVPQKPRKKKMPLWMYLSY